MKVIDFLVELEKGNIPDKIIYDNRLFVYDSDVKDYIIKNNNNDWFFENYIKDMIILSQEVMVINDDYNLLVAQNEVNRLMDTIKKVNEDLDKLRGSINNE